MKTLIVFVVVVASLSSAVQAQFGPQRQDANVLPLQSRKQLVMERAQRNATARQERITAQRQNCRNRVEWYMGSDGFMIRKW